MNQQEMGFIAKDVITRFHACAFDSTVNQVTATVGDGETIAGIVQDTSVAGSPVDVKFSGLSKAVIKTASGVTPGKALQSFTDGTLLAATTADIVVARAMETPGADGDIILVQLGPFTIY